MKCPECERTGERSKLYMPDGYLCTDMGGTQTYYDEDGHHHYHDVNSRTGQGNCSNGHILTVTASTKCPAEGGFGSTGFCGTNPVRKRADRHPEADLARHARKPLMLCLTLRCGTNGRLTPVGADHCLVDVNAPDSRLGRLPSPKLTN